MQEFSWYYVLATVCCIAMAIWLRVRLFGSLHSEGAESAAPQVADAPEQQLPISS